MFTPALYEIAIFRTGTHTASNGVQFTFSHKDLQEVVDTFNPLIFRPPLIVSHDIGENADHSIADKELCYGVPKYLRLVGDVLKAGYDYIAPQLLYWVHHQRLHSVSASFYLPNSPNNPYPGKFSLRHVACLGATAPAVKGLAPFLVPPDILKAALDSIPPAVKGLAPLSLCEFSINEHLEGVVSFTMDDNLYDDPWVLAARLFRNMREYLISEESLEVADRVLPADLIDQLASMGDDDDDDDDDSDLMNQIGMLKAQMAVMASAPPPLSQPTYSEKKMHPIRKMMEDKKMSSSDVADGTGMDEDDVDAVADGDRKPSESEKKKLAKHLGVTHDDIHKASMSTADMQEWAQELATREQAINARVVEFEQREVADFVEVLVRQGKVKAVKRDDVVTLLLNTPGDTKAEFSEEAGGSKSPRQELMDMLKDQPSWNYGEEIVAPLNDIAVPPNFSAPSGFGVDKRSGDAYRRAQAYCVANRLDPNKDSDWQQALQNTQGAMNGKH